jgi:hypothetical protein
MDAESEAGIERAKARRAGANVRRCGTGNPEPRHQKLNEQAIDGVQTMRRLMIAVQHASWSMATASLFVTAAARCQEPDYRVEPVPPDPLAGSPVTDPAATGENVETIFASLLPPRTDSPLDWIAGPEPLHSCNEPRALAPCVPPPPCHPADPPAAYDLIGVRGVPSCGPIYGGPCRPRTGSRDGERLAWLHWIPDRLFDLFYTPK